MSYLHTKRNIEKNKIAPVYLLTGTEAFLIDDITHSVVNQTLNEAERDFNLSVFEMKETPVDMAIEDAQTLPFLGEKRVVIVKEAYFLTGQRDEAKIEHNVKVLEEYVQNPANETVLIITAPYEKLDERKKITKVLKEKTEVVDSKEFDEKMTMEWLTAQAREFGADITDKGKETLIQLQSGNLLMIANEVKKLALYVGEGGTIDEEIVHLLVARTIEQDIFSLIDHVIHRRIEKGLDIFFDLLRQKEDPLKVVALLARQFRILYMVSEMSKQGYSQKQMASQLKLHPYVVKLAGQQAKKFNERQLLVWLDGLATVDFQIKTGQMDKKLAVELFLMKMNPKENVVSKA
ncbi:DNA polymerase III subunit delta [Alkalihalobacterium bogoriense]|uniref:DNA polymerase III subunit delta n=1 Tax=Alkalihalobacterium bogoriense TaxID=246272 RepID=UPI00047CC62F|nr:DNA polymerase III subunit delta [Alkalihalobacterium bogoriense]